MYRNLEHQNPSLFRDLTIVLLSEMGRFPKLDQRQGKTHWMHTSCVLIGSGVRGDQIVGAYDSDCYSQPVSLQTGEVTSNGVYLLPFSYRIHLTTISRCSYTRRISRLSSNRGGIIMIFPSPRLSKEDVFNGEPHPVDFEIPIEELELLINQSFDSGLPSMLEVNDVYVEMMSWGDEECPLFSPYVNGLEGHWADDCTSSNGAHFFGFAQLLRCPTLATAGWNKKMGTIWSSFETTSPDGKTIQLGGTGTLRLHPEMGTVAQMFQGTFWVSDANYWLEGGSQSYGMEGVLGEVMTFSGGGGAIS